MCRKKLKIYLYNIKKKFAKIFTDYLKQYQQEIHNNTK